MNIQFLKSLKHSKIAMIEKCIRNHIKKYLHTKKKKYTFGKCYDKKYVNEIKHDILGE